jgi:hypothetical protein
MVTLEEGLGRFGVSLSLWSYAEPLRSLHEAAFKRRRIVTTTSLSSCLATAATTKAHRAAVRVLEVSVTPDLLNQVTDNNLWGGYL